MTELKSVIDNFKVTRQELKRGLRNSVNQVISNARKIAVKRISEETGLAAKTVRNNLRQESAKQESFNAKLYATTTRKTISAYKPSLSFKGSRGTISADISMLRQKQEIGNRAFATKSKKLFRRLGNTAYPIVIATGPSVEHQYSRIAQEIIEEINRDLIAIVSEKFIAQLKKRK